MTISVSSWAFARQHRHLAIAGTSQLISMVFAVLGAGALIRELTAPPAGFYRIVLALMLSIVALLILCVSVLYGRREIHSMATLYEAASEVQVQTDELFGMADMLQSAEGYEDATAVLMATTQRLLPEHGVALYIFNNSHDLLDLSGSWNMSDEYSPSGSLAPSNCWALKRGKPHINDPSDITLCCAHHTGTATTIELPMLARGAVYGLLVFAIPPQHQARAKLAETSRLGTAIADSMSLALSNISLREKLRTQSLRDPLTGLYNRRYMEDALERLVNLGERSGTSTAVLMLDLDNFKRLNDTHGHAKGDAVLRDVASQLVGGARPSDVVCRYGGEELMVILPNCSLQDAALKAESLRLRIESVSQLHGTPVSASIGVAAIPETSTSIADLVPTADAALYNAKHEGKNRVVCADRRHSRDDAPPILKVIA